MLALQPRNSIRLRSPFLSDPFKQETMRASHFTAAWLATVAGSSVIPAFGETTTVLSLGKRDAISLDALRAKALQTDVYAGLAAMNQQIFQATQKPSQWKTCNPSNMIVRREWFTTQLFGQRTWTNPHRAAFSTSERKNYISAVQCMSKLPPKTPVAECPGCKNRYDDFVATHMKQTFYPQHWQLPRVAPLFHVRI